MIQGILTRVVIAAVAITVAAVFLVAAGAFLCVALYDGLAALIPSSPALAALATAALLLLAMVLVLAAGNAIAKTAEKSAKAKADEKGPAMARLGLEVGKLMGEQAVRYAGKNPTKVLVGAIVAGFALGAVPKLRQFLMDLLKGK